MKKYQSHIAVIGLFAIAALAFASGRVSGGWNLESDKDGIKIYTRPVSGSKLKQVRAVTRVHAQFGTLVHILTDFDNYEAWMNNLVDCSVVEHPEDSVFVVFAHDDAPWPVQDRYHYDKMIISTGDSIATVSFKSMPRYGNGGDDKIEKEWHEGWWKVLDVGQGYCEIEFILNENPGGYVPPWLVNYLAVDAPYKTLSNLKARAESMGRP